MMRTGSLLIILGTLAAVTSAAIAGAVAGEGNPMSVTIERKTCRAPDGVTIVYSTAGAGETALVFIHGGLADRSFFDGQLRAFADRYRVIALDLAGHGESGANRTKWELPEFGADVKAVIDAEKLKRVVLFGNSLGGPTAIEAALILPDRVIGVVGIDTFHSLDYQIAPEEARQRAEAFRADFSGSVKDMMKMLFHTDADPALIAEAEKRMQKTPPAAAYDIFISLAGYDQAATGRKLAVPLRAINGDLYPTDVESVRKIKADFDAVVMKHMGHYPMLERPDEFNRHIADVVQELSRGTTQAP
jgi:pimeloyl-ACP methyl ester carboxylesterase